MISLGNNCHASSTHFIICSFDGALIFPCSVNVNNSSDRHLSYISLRYSFMGLFHDTSGACINFVHPPGITTGSIFLSFNISLTERVKRHLKVSQVSRHLDLDSNVKTHNTSLQYFSLNGSSIHPEALCVTMHLFLYNPFNLFTSRLPPLETIKGFFFESSAVVARQTVIFNFS